MRILTYHTTIFEFLFLTIWLLNFEAAVRTVSDYSEKKEVKISIIMRRNKTTYRESRESEVHLDFRFLVKNGPPERKVTHMN